MSGLQGGTTNFKIFLFLDTSKPSFSSILINSLFSTLNPVVFSKRKGSKFIIVFLKFSIFFTSKLLISPPQICFISSEAFINPSSIERGSMPLSNLNFASVSIFNCLEVFLIERGKK